MSSPGMFLGYVYSLSSPKSSFFCSKFQSGHRLTISNAMLINSGVYSCQYISSGGAVVVTDTQVSISECVRTCVCMLLCVYVRSRL